MQLTQSGVLCLSLSYFQVVAHLEITPWFMKGVFEARPSLPRYRDMWDVFHKFVLDNLRTLSPLEQLILRDIITGRKNGFDRGQI